MTRDAYHGFASLMLLYSVWDIYWMYHGRGFAKYWWVDVFGNLFWAACALYSARYEVDDIDLTRLSSQDAPAAAAGARATTRSG